MKDTLLKRFSSYIAYATTSDENSETYPSTPGQLVFGDFLVEELKRIGLSEVNKDQYGYVTATLPANCDKVLPVVGFIAHFDTAPDMPGISAPRIIQTTEYVSCTHVHKYHYDTVTYEPVYIDFDMGYAVVCDAETSTGNVLTHAINGTQPYRYESSLERDTS